MTTLESHSLKTEGPKPAARLTSYSVEDLSPHPAMTKMGLLPSARDVTDAIARREQGHSDPVTVSQERYILTGYAQWMLARKKNEPAIPCLQVEVSGDEALLWLIQSHQRSVSLNDFNRITLALELEPWFRTRARSNQRLGGQIKGSSTLTEADRMDVRAQIAIAAGVSIGNVSKVKGLISAALPEVLEALRNDEVSIHRASIWLQRPESQLEELRWSRNRRGIERSVSSLLSKHGTAGAETEHRLDICRVANAMLAMAKCKEASVFVREVQIPGKALLLSSELVKALENQGKLAL